MSARFLLQPRWWLSHLFVLTLVVVMVNLGFWQLRRLDQRRESNDIVAARLDEPPIPIEEVDDPAGARFVRVTVSGRYTQHEVVVDNRTSGGFAGDWRAVLVDIGGERVLVSRGFAVADEAVESPAGEARIEGYLIPRARLDRTARLDLDAVFDEPGVVQALVQQTASDPPDAPELDPVAPPDLDEGRHFSYAMQWFIFSTIACVGYPLALRRIVRRRGKELDDQPST